MSSAGEVLRSTLGAASFALLEEAGVAEYVEETLAGVVGDGGGREDVQEAVLPFLLDAGAVADEEVGATLCGDLWQRLQGEGPAPEAEQLKKLDTAVSMGKLVKTDEAAAKAEHAAALRSPRSLPGVISCSGVLGCSRWFLGALDVSSEPSDRGSRHPLS